MMLDPALITARVTSILEKLHLRYFIGGSFASTLHGMIRTTQDSDIIAEFKPELVNAFCRELTDEFYIDDQMIVNAIIRRSSFNIIHKESFFKVDIFVPEIRPFVREEMLRAQRQILSVDPPAEALVATSEDILLAKLEWYRLGGDVSERQWRDILGIMEVQGRNLDFDYLHQWANELAVDDLLERALRECTL